MTLAKIPSPRTAAKIKIRKVKIRQTLISTEESGCFLILKIASKGMKQAMIM